jgi:glycine/D-amino acid oxidase-like deaminating enzyme/nitrite reductase/ring-hydroxylating ferredoxin subunit
MATGETRGAAADADGGAMRPAREGREGARPSVWEGTAAVPDYAALAEDLAADVCVVGAGIAGLTTAYHLAGAGRRVVVLDKGPVGGGETGRTTAQVATSFDDYYHEAERVHGAAAARLLAESFRAGVDAVERVVRDEGIDCDWARVDGFWFPAPDDAARGRALLEKERDAARRAGLADVELLDDWPDPRARAFGPGPVLRFPGQGQFDIHKYVAGLARAVERRGGRIFAHTHVGDVEPGAGGAPHVVRAAGGRTVTAPELVVATNSPINDRYAMHTKQAPYRTYVIAARVPRAAVPAAFYWDTRDPYHYVRWLRPPGADAAEGGTDLLLVGGEDHKTGQAEGPEEDAFDRLERWTRERFPVEGVEYRWSGQVLEPVDFVAFIGRNPGDERVYIATGDSGNGMTHGTVAGLLLSDLVLGRPNPWVDLYDPSRVSLRAAGTWLEENLNVAAQYADYVTPAEAGRAEEVPPGEGRVLRRGGQPVAVYRAPDGAVTERSAVCPHLFCVVDWNSAEKTWDCPCHGSRFAVDGSVVTGPSRAPLAPAGDPPDGGRARRERPGA